MLRLLQLDDIPNERVFDSGHKVGNVTISILLDQAYVRFYLAISFVKRKQKMRMKAEETLKIAFFRLGAIYQRFQVRQPLGLEPGA
jgi:hypothetical protein